MTERQETWKKFTLICRRCGRHEDEGVYTIQGYYDEVEIHCPCGEKESYSPNREPEIWTSNGIIRGERAKMMSKAFEVAFAEDEVRGIPMNPTTDSERTPEEQENFNKIINSMREAGRQALKEGQEE